MRVRKALEPESGRWGLLGQGKHSLRCGIVDNVELVVELKNHAFVWRTGIDIGDIFRPGLTKTPERGSFPVITPLPDIPGTVRIEAFQGVGSEGNRRVEFKLRWVCLFLEDVFRHDPAGVPPHRKKRVKPGIRSFQLEYNRILVRRANGVDTGQKPGSPH